MTMRHMKGVLRVVAMLWIFLVPDWCLSEEILEPADFPSLMSGIRITGPLDFCGEPVPLDMQEVRERLEKEMLLSLWDRAQVILWIKRSNRYFPIIEKRLKQNGLPDDLKYVAVVESALRPHAGSVKGAMGYWQFIKSTGLKYGLAINRKIDERRNIFTSTEAAIRYFKALYGLTGSWTLSAAAYNMGEHGLLAAASTQQLKDYYRLYIPLETQRYILKILSVKLILSNPEKYGFKLRDEDLYPPLEFDRLVVKTRQETSIQIVARAAGTYYKKIKDLNPQIRGRTIHRGSQTIFVPKGAGKGLQQRYKALAKWDDAAKTKKRVYVVKKGDSLSRIAKRFRVPLSSLLAWNRLKINNAIHPGDRLVVYQ